MLPGGAGGCPLDGEASVDLREGEGISGTCSGGICRSASENVWGGAKDKVILGRQRQVRRMGSSDTSISDLNSSEAALQEKMSAMQHRLRSLEAFYSQSAAQPACVR